MPRRTICPSCEAALIVAEDPSIPFVTCPRCLATVANPGGAAASRGAETEVAAATPTSSSRSCPECGRPVEAGWVLCPFCGASLRRRRQGRNLPSVDVEVRRDTSFIGGGLVLVGMLGALGIIFVFCSGGAETQAAGGAGILVGLALVIAVGVGMALAILGRRQAVQLTVIIAGVVALLLLLPALGISFIISVCGK